MIILSYLAVFAYNWIFASWTKIHFDAFKWYFNDIRDYMGVQSIFRLFLQLRMCKLKRNNLRHELKKYMLKRALIYRYILFFPCLNFIIILHKVIFYFNIIYHLSYICIFCVQIYFSWNYTHPTPHLNPSALSNIEEFFKLHTLG